MVHRRQEVTFYGIAFDWSDAQHAENAERIARQERAGLQVGMFDVDQKRQSTGAMDLGFLRHYKGIVELILQDVRIKSLAPVAGLTSLRRLHIGNVGRSALDGAHLSDLVELRSLHVTNMCDLGFVGQLPNLERLVLSVSLRNLSSMSRATSLKDLNISFGSLESLHGLEGMSNLERLETTRVKKLGDLGALSSLNGLEELVITDAPRVEAMPQLRGLKSLRCVVLQNVKGLIDASALSELQLEEFAILSKLSPAGLESLRGLRAKRLYIELFTKRHNAAAERILGPNTVKTLNEFRWYLPRHMR